MRVRGESSHFGLCARFLALAAGSMLLANCSAGGKIDPKYGVTASPRVVDPGEPVPKGGGKYRIGKPYTIAGRVYVPAEDVNYKAEGYASWYGDAFHGRYTANGEVFDMNSITAAHPTMPLPSYARVTNLRNQKSIMVRVNDRGPYVGNRIIDLSNKTAKLLDFHGHGLAKVRVEYIGRAPLNGSDDRTLMATLRDGNSPVAERPVQVASNVPPNKSYTSTFFDSRPLSEAPRPPERPFDGTSSRQVAAVEVDEDVAPATQPAAPTVQLAAAARPRMVETVSHTVNPAASPVSAYAPTRYDGHAGFMSGRGLY